MPTAAKKILFLDHARHAPDFFLDADVGEDAVDQQVVRLKRSESAR